MFNLNISYIISKIIKVIKQSLKMKKIDKILVTGGCGFIGSNFINNILNKYNNKQVVNVDKLSYAGNLENLRGIESNENYLFSHTDIADIESLKKLFNEHKFDAVIHFAAESHVDRSISNPKEFIETNIIGTYNLLECSLDQYKQNNNFVFLHVSTDEVYGTLELEDHPFKETNQYLPNSPYSASKASSDHLVRAWHHTFNLPVLTTNCSNNYGPYQFPEKLIPSIITNALQGKSIKIYGEGLAIRDWLYVVDHCEAIEAVLEKGIKGETYNIGGGFERTNIDITNKICALLDELAPPTEELIFRENKSLKVSSYSELITFVEERSGHDQRYAIDSTKIQSELSWTPNESLESGLKHTVEWYLNNTDWLLNILKKN